MEVRRRGKEAAPSELPKPENTDEKRDDIKSRPLTIIGEDSIKDAARSLFAKFNCGHKNVVSVEEFVQAVDATSLPVTEKTMLKSQAKKLGDQIAEEEFVDAVSKRLQGGMEPGVHHDGEAFNKASLYEKVRKYPATSAKVMLEKGLDYVSESGLSFITSFLPVNQLYILFSLIIYSFVTSSFIFHIVPLLIFYISSASLLVTTLKLISNQRHQSNTAAWVELMHKMDIKVVIGIRQLEFFFRSIKLYIIFFISLLTALISFPLSDKSWIPCSELCVISAGFALASFIALNDSRDWLIPASFICNVVASLPVFFHGFQFGSHIANFISTPFFSISIGPFFILNLGIPGILYGIVPVLFIIMAARESWEGTYKILVPHLVCYVWWNSTVTLFPHTTGLGLLRATIGYLFLPILVPIAIVLIVYYCVNFMIGIILSEYFAKIFITLVLIAIPTIIFKSKSYLSKSKDSRYLKARKVLLVVFGIFSLLPLTFIKIPTFKAPSVTNLTYKKFMESCRIPSSNGNLIQQQKLCYHLKGVKVKWTGMVAGVKVTKMENSYEDALKSLPKFLGEPLKCVYGEEYRCKETSEAGSEAGVCYLIGDTHKRCHMHLYDTYQFQVDVQMSETDSIRLMAGHRFQTTLAILEKHDKINFTAVLNENLGHGVPSLILKNITCLDRILSPPSDKMVDPEDDLRTKLDDLISVVVHFFAYPLIEYIPSEA